MSAPEKTALEAQLSAAAWGEKTRVTPERQSDQASNDSYTPAASDPYSQGPDAALAEHGRARVRFADRDEMDVDETGSIDNYADDSANDDTEEEVPVPFNVSTSLTVSSRRAFADRMSPSRGTSRSATNRPAVQSRSTGRRMPRSGSDLPAVEDRSTGRYLSRSTLNLPAVDDRSIGRRVPRSALTLPSVEDRPTGRNMNQSKAGKRASHRMIGNVYEDSDTSGGEEEDEDEDEDEDEAEDERDEEMEEPAAYEPEAYEPRGKSRRSASYVRYSDDETDIDDSELSYHPVAEKPSKTRGAARGRGSRSHATRSTEHPARRSFNQGGFTVPDILRRPARGPGSRVVSSCNKTPDRIASESVAEARRMMQGGPRRAAGSTARRAHGPNDPENIMIVNLKENENMKWEEIAKILNDGRIETGRKPDLTSNSVHNRYNRNAPILFAAEGKEFVPIKERRPGYKTHTKWNPERDQALMDAVREQEESKWFTIARLYSERTGHHIDAQTAAYRHSLI